MSGTAGKLILPVSLALAILLFIAPVFACRNLPAQRTTGIPTAPPGQSSTPGEAPLVTSIAKGLEVPWALDFLPDRSIIFTERPGRIRLIDSRNGLLSGPLLTIDEVIASGEGGLLGLTLHPDFEQNNYVYVYYTYRQGQGLTNRVIRYTMQDRKLADNTTIIDNIPAASIHDGGRLKFGPDKLLYITTGDSSNSQLAQDRNSLAGKILRLDSDGAVPPDNPFPGSPVYTLGHRNPQGIAWDDQGRLWSTEHGSSATDELNLIEAGKNYGWPLIRGDETRPGMETPVLNSGNQTWAPSGMAFRNGSLFFTGLRGQGLFEVKLDGLVLLRHFEGQFGRLRDVVTGPDGLLYISTNNRDGRGSPAPDDDQLLRINPAKL